MYSKIHYYHLKHPNKNWDSIYDEYGKAAGVGSSEELKHNYENNYVNNVSYTAEDKIYEELAKDVISGKELKDLKTKKKYMQAYINENLIELDDDKLVLKKDKIKDNQAFKKLITAEIEELNKKLEEEKEKGKDKDKKEGYEKEIKKLRKFVVE